MVASKPHVSAAVYLARERESQEKHALWDGNVFAMAGASPRHNRIVAGLLRAFGVALLGKPCQPFASDQRIRIVGTERYVYPDATVICPPFEADPNDEMTLQNPKLVAEVLSPTTEAFDRGDNSHRRWDSNKGIAYRSIPSLADYLLLGQDGPRVEHYTRETGGSWRLSTLGATDVVALRALAIEVRVADIYAGIE